MLLVRHEGVLAAVPMRTLFLLITIIWGSFLLFYISTTHDSSLGFKVEYNNGIHWKYQSKRDHSSSTIRTKGCRIPFMSPIDDSIRPFVVYPKNMTCRVKPLLAANKTHISILTKNMHFYNISNEKKFSCCYKSFFRPVQIDDITFSGIDARVKYNECINFTDTLKASDEFVRVICSDGLEPVFDTFFLFAIEKDLVKSDLPTDSLKYLPYNVLILGLDSVSRLNFHRTMPKTLSYLTKLGAIELLGYNKVGDNTFPNLIPMLLGRKDSELSEACLPDSHSTFDNCPFVWSQFKQAGFTTALAEDTSWLGTFNYGRRGFSGAPADYYLHTFFEQAERHAGTRHSNTYICMNDKFFFNILLDYVDDLTTTLRTKLFGFFWETSMSHDDLNFPMLMDDSYLKIISKMYYSGYLNESIIFLVSDHGMRWGSFRNTNQGRLEDRLPFVFALMPPSFRNKYSEAYENMKLNRQRLTTPFDLHATLIDLKNLDGIENERIIKRSKEYYSNTRSISLFLPVPENRTCKSAEIDDHWCTCHKSKKGSIYSTEASEAAEYVVSYINGVLESYVQCATLAVDEVLEVSRMRVGGAGGAGAAVEWPGATVVLRAAPGGGVFEATLNGAGGAGVSRWALSGSVSRLNTYGNQSHCVMQNQLKLYCYCKST